MKKKKIKTIIVSILLALSILKIVCKHAFKIPENATINVYLQVNANTQLLISDDNTYQLKKRLNGRIRIPKLFDEKTMLTEGDYIIDIYQNDQKIHSYRIHDEKNIYDEINDSLYKCNCLDELRGILIEYVYDNYLINLDSTFD